MTLQAFQLLPQRQESRGRGHRHAAHAFSMSLRAPALPMSMLRLTYSCPAPRVKEQCLLRVRRARYGARASHERHWHKLPVEMRAR